MSNGTENFPKMPPYEIDRSKADAANVVTQGRRQFEKTAPIPMLVDPRRAQLIALFDLSDVRGQDLLLAIAGIHAARYPKDRK